MVQPLSSFQTWCLVFWNIYSGNWLMKCLVVAVDFESIFTRCDFKVWEPQMSNTLDFLKSNHPGSTQLVPIGWFNPIPEIIRNPLFQHPLDPTWPCIPGTTRKKTSSQIAGGWSLRRWMASTSQCGEAHRGAQLGWIGLNWVDGCLDDFLKHDEPCCFGGRFDRFGGFWRGVQLEWPFHQPHGCSMLQQSILVKSCEWKLKILKSWNFPVWMTCAAPSRLAVFSLSAERSTWRCQAPGPSRRCHGRGNEGELWWTTLGPLALGDFPRHSQTFSDKAIWVSGILWLYRLPNDCWWKSPRDAGVIARGMPWPSVVCSGHVGILRLGPSRENGVTPIDLYNPFWSFIYLWDGWLKHWP